MKCHGGCGRTITPATADDCGPQRGPWYCARCFEQEKMARENQEEIERAELDALELQMEYNW